MIPVTVGHDDVSDLFCGKAVEQGLNMLRVVRSGIDYCYFSLAKNVRACAMKGEWPWVSCCQAAKTGRNRLNDPIGKVMVPEKRNLYHV